MGKIQNDGTFRLLFVVKSGSFWYANTINNDGTTTFQRYQITTGAINTTRRELYYLDVLNKTLYYRQSTTSSSTSVTDTFIEQLLECDAVMYSPVTTSTPSFGVLSNIGHTGTYLDDIKTTSLVPYRTTLERPILSINDATATVKGISRPDGTTLSISSGVVSVDTTWLQQYILDTFDVQLKQGE